MSQISSKTECDECDKMFHIRNVLICLKCKKQLCNKCKMYLAQRTEEVNFDNHYCGRKEPGVLVKLYNG